MDYQNLFLYKIQTTNIFWLKQYFQNADHDNFFSLQFLYIYHVFNFIHLTKIKGETYIVIDVAIYLNSTNRCTCLRFYYKLFTRDIS